jgi:putative DNA primase/helicase
MRPLDAALRWARGEEIGRACPVAPARPGSKVPLLPAGAGGSGGYNLATADLDRIRGWWADAPGAGVAIHVERAGLVVLDVEGPSKGVDPHKVVAAIKSAGYVLPRTRVHRTPGGGFHYIYTRPAGVGHEAIVTGVPGVEGAEVRRNGVVLVPPSIVDGRAYELAVEAPLAVAPSWLRRPAERRRPGAPAPADGSRLGPGARHDHLMRLACAMRRRGAYEETILAALRAENAARCEPPHSDDKLVALAADIYARYAPDTRSA